MQVWVSLLLMFLELGAKLLKSADKDSYNKFRASVAADGVGVLLAQLNPNGTNTADSSKSSEAGTGRGAGRVDE